MSLTLDIIVNPTRAMVGLKKFDRGLDSSGRRVKRFASTADRSMTSLGSTMKRVGAIATAALAFGGIAAGIRGVVSTIASFESTMALTGAVAGVDRLSDQYKALSDRARELGATTRFSATQAGEGLLFLARAGFTAEEAMGAVGGALNLAAAGAISLGDAADIASNIGSTFADQFGGKVEATAASIDVLVAASNRANTNVAQLAEALKFAGPTASAFGISMEDAAASLAQLGNFGIQASMAGTNLRAILAALVGGSDKAEAALKRLGLTQADLSPETNTLAEIFAKLEGASLGAADALAIFGRRNAGAALILAKSSAETALLAEELRNAEGEAQRIADAMNDTLIGAFLAMKSAFQEAALQIGERGFGGALRKTVDFITGVVRVFIGMTEEGKEASKAVLRVAEALKVAGVAAATMVTIKLAGFFIAATRAVIGFTVAMAANPFGLAAIAVTALVSGLFALRNKVINLGGEPMKILDIMIATWEHMGEVVKVVFRTIGEVVPVIMNKVGEIFSGVFRIMGEVAFGFLDELFPGFKSVFDAIGTNVIGGFARATIAVINGLIGVLGAAFRSVTNFVNAFGTLDFTNIKTLGISLAQFSGQIAVAFNGLGIDASTAFADGVLKGASGKDLIESLLGLEGDFNTAFVETLGKFGATITEEEFASLFLPSNVTASILTRARELFEERNRLIEEGEDKNIETIRQKEEELRIELEKLNNLPDPAEGANADSGFGFSSFSATVVSGLGDIIKQTTSAAEGFKNMGRAILDLAIQKLVLDQLAESMDNFFGGGGSAGGSTGGIAGGIGGILGSLFSAKGNAFGSGGSVSAFAKGGVLTDTAIFPMRNGGIGVAGEAGDEPVMGLARDSQGNLGVRSIGGGGTTINMGGIVIQANNPGEFHAGLRQTASDAVEVMRRATSGG